MTALPSIWMIGDVQGCCTPLKELLKQPDIALEPQAQFWFAGDLVNRGPNSLEALRHIISLGNLATCVLGNHDLHLLGVAAGIRKLGKSDTITRILNAPDSNDLIDWLRHRPLVHYERGHLLVHAGVLPQWDVDKVLGLANEIQTALRSHNWKDKLQHMYGNEPAYWNNGLTGGKRLRVIINALTRMRLCNSKGGMDFDQKNAPKAASTGSIPWFDVPNRAMRHQTIVFGHWSTLGVMIRPDAICLDSGCVWGRTLTALRMHDHKLVQVACAQYQKPHSH